MSLVLGRVGDLAPGGMAVFDVEGARVTVANVDGKYFGFSDLCTHQGCSLASGKLDDRTLTCPCHDSQFDVTNGNVLRGPASTPIDIYELEVHDDELTLNIPEEAAPTGALAGVDLFAGLDHNTLESLEAFTFRRTFAPGATIVEEGRTGNGLFVVLSGEVEVVKGLAAEQPRSIATLGRGEPFGELSLLGDWPRNASVRAVSETECLGMDRWVFLAYLRRDPELAIRMLQVLAKRLANTSERLVE